MEVTTKKQNRRKIVIGVLIAVVVLVAAVIAFASTWSIMPLGAAGTAVTVRWRWMWKPPRLAWNS